MNEVRSIIEIYRRFLEYNQMLNLRDSLSFIFFELIKKEKVKKIEVHNEQLFVRTNSPDLKVVIRTLFNSEFDDIDLEDPTVIIDAGAYIGTSAIFFSKKFPKAKIYAIEPETDNFEMLRRNTESFENIILIKAGLWSTNDTRIIQNRFTGHWGYTISDTFNQTVSINQEINCITIMDVLKKYNLDQIDILKMDIEGSEKNVLENSTEWISLVQVISVELHDRIVNGCDRAFYLSTKDFTKFTKKGEKITAYRN